MKRKYPTGFSKKLKAWPGARYLVAASSKNKKMKFLMKRKKRTRFSRPKATTSRNLTRSFGKKKATAIIKAVKEVAKDQNISTYRKLLFGDFNPMIYYNAGANTGVPIGKKHFFCHFKKATNNSTFSQTGLELSCFTPFKIVDACSVLFNGKTAAAAIETLTDNIAASTVAHFTYASSQFEMVNLTTRVYDIKIYEMHNTKDVHSVSPIYDAYNSISSHLWVSAPSGALAASNGEMYLDDALELSDLTLKKWKIAKVIKLDNFKPGQTYKWMKSIAHKTFKFENLVDSGNVVRSYGPGSVVYVIEAQTTPQLLYNATAADTTYGRVTPANEASQSFGFRMREVYKVAEPEDVTDDHEGIKTALYSDASLNGITPTAALERYNQKNNFYSTTSSGV